MEINFKDVIKTDISFLLDYYDNIGHIASSQQEIFPQIEHYKLLTYLSFKFNGVTIIDAGTHHGLSSICLAQNKNNTVVSYDIVNIDKYAKLCPFQHTPIGDNYPNITYMTQDINEVDNEVLNKADFIFLDIIHDGSEETKFSNKLIEMKYKGFVLCDDVGLSGELRYPLDNWFNNLPWSKYDLTKVGHFSGSGLLDCGDKGVKLSEEIK
jgi:predicted O-methyltransferase YrrM